jgi:hypothetical protein
MDNSGRPQTDPNYWITQFFDRTLSSEEYHSEEMQKFIDDIYDILYDPNNDFKIVNILTITDVSKLKDLFGSLDKHLMYLRLKGE